MNIILSLFDYIFAIIKAIINMHYYILKNIRKNYLDKNYKEHNISNIFSLILKIIFLSIYEFFVFHIYIFIFLITKVNIGPFGICLRFVLTISVSCLLAYISGEIKFILNYLYYLFLSICHLFTYVISLCFYIITWNKELKNVISFKKQFKGVEEILIIYQIIIMQIYRFIIALPHLTNFFSIIRLYELYKNNNNPDSSLLTKSFLLIFFDVFILIPTYIVILILPPVFISTNIYICKALNYNKNNENDIFPKYNKIKKQILNDIIKVGVYIIAILLTLISFLFVWKIDKSIKNLIELFKTNDYKKFFDNYLDNYKKSSFDVINIITNIFIFTLNIIGNTFSLILLNIVLFIFAIPFVWKWNKFYKIWILFIKKKEVEQYLDNYFSIYKSCINDIINITSKTLMFSICTFLTILSFPFVWRIKAFLKNLIELFKTSEYSIFFTNYFENLNECFSQCINFGKKLFLLSFAIILTLINIPFIWKWKGFIKNLIELFKTNDYQNFFINYFDMMKNTIQQLFYLLEKIIGFSFATLLTILLFPLFWKVNGLENNLIQLFKTNDYKIFFINYFDIIINTIKQLIDLSKKIIIFSIALFFTILSIPFFWKINKFIINLIQIFKTNDYETFFINYFDYFWDGLVELVLSIFIILNHLSIIHIKALYDCYYSIRKEVKIKKNYFYLNYIIFIQKWLDIFTFILSILRLINISFYFQLLHEKYKINFFFDLLYNNKYLIENNDNDEKRIEVIFLLIFDIFTSFLMIFQVVLGILNPFLTLKIIRHICLFFITSKNQKDIKFEKIIYEFIKKSIKKLKIILFVDFVYLPISLIMNIIAFWTIKYNIFLLISINKKSCNKFNNIQNKSANYVNNNNNLKEKNELVKYKNNLLLIFEKLMIGYILIFKGIVIILNIFRIFILFLKFRKNKIKTKEVNINNLIDDQFKYAIMELIFIPFLLIISILQPWNYELIKEFFEAKSCGTKFEKFGDLFKQFFKDFFYIFIFLLLMISLIDAIPTLLLVFRSIKRKIFPSEENKLIYALNYKTENFRTELIQIYNKNVKKITTTFLFILNILLISRINPLFRQTWPFFKQFFKNIKSYFENLFDFKKNKTIENDNLTKMPYIIMSEICSFLKVDEVNNLNRTNKKINEKTNINYIWENIYKKKYDKLLKEVLNDKEYKEFSKIEVDNYKEICKHSCSIILSKQGKAPQKIKTFSEIVREETINSLNNLLYLITLPIYFLFYSPFFIIINIYYIIYLLLRILYTILLFLLSLFRYLLLFLSLLLYKLNKFLVYITQIERFYEKSLVININEQERDITISSILKNIFRIISQVSIIFYIIFLIPQLLLKYIFGYLNIILFYICEYLIYIFSYERIYEKELITKTNSDKTSNPIIVNIKEIGIIFLQIVIIVYYIFLIHQIFLRYILKILNLSLFKIYEVMNTTLNLEKLYEKEFIDNIYMDKSLNIILVNFYGIINVFFQIIMISYSLFLIPQLLLRFILKYLNLSLYKIHDFLIIQFSFKKIIEKSLISNIYDYTKLNPIIANIKGIYIAIIQIIIISYFIFLIPQILLRFILENINLILYKINDFLRIKLILKEYYKKTIITEIYKDKTLNPILANIKGMFIIIFQTIIFGYYVFIIPQLILRYILKIINFALYEISNFLANKFAMIKFYEKTLIANIYDNKTLNPILINIEGIFIIIFQIIIICYYLFMLPQLILRSIFKILNFALYEICNFLANKFGIIKFYEKTLISNIYDDKTLNPILVNIKGIFIIIFQILILIYIIFLIPQIISIKFIACNFNKKSSNTSLNERIQSCSFFILLIQLIYGLIYFIINFTICVLPSLYYIFIDLDFKSKNNFKQTIKDLTEIIYYSTMKKFMQIFLGKYYLNALLYYLNTLIVNHTIISLSKTTDIIFVKILDNIYSEYHKLSVSFFFPLKYVLKYIGISFKAISIKIKNISKYLDIVLNIFALTICIIPFYLLYICFENDSKKIMFIEVPIFIYLVFNMWICGRAINEIEKQYGAF